MTPTTPSKSRPPPGWPNRQTLTTSSMVAVNLACHLLERSLVTTAAINLPLRCISVYQAYDSKRYYKLSMDLAAFVLLTIPQGILFSISLDVMSEVLNFCNHPKDKSPQNSPFTSSTKRLNPLIFENARKILNLSPEEAKDSAKIKSKYDEITQELKKKIQGVSKPLQPGLQQIIDDAHEAYTTLVKQRDVRIS